MEVLKEVLVNGLNSIGLSVDEHRINRLLQFQKLLENWNKTYNLSSIRDPEEMIRFHLLDSLAVARYVPGRRIADVGTGAGMPGIPLALLDDEKWFYLIDSNSKKTRFVQQAVIELKLNNITVIHGRAEEIELQNKVDAVVVRALSSLSDILEKTKHLVIKGGVILALKGRFPYQELQDIREGQYSVVPLDIPSIPAQRHLVLLTP